MAAFFVVLACVAFDPSLPASPASVKQYAQHYAKTAAPKSRVDLIKGFDCQCAVLIHPSTERAPATLRGSVKEWAKTQNWRGRLVILEFYDGYDGSKEAKRFVDEVFPTIQGGQSMNLRIVRYDTTVIWGDGDAIERGRQ